MERKRYVSEFENDFERAYERKTKNFRIRTCEVLLVKAITARKGYLCGLLTAREAVREILEAWNELDSIL